MPTELCLTWGLAFEILKASVHMTENVKLSLCLDFEKLVFAT